MFLFRMLKIKEAKTQANESPVCVTFIPEGIGTVSKVELTYKLYEGQTLSLPAN